jgi:hypothetical protein
LLHRAFHAHDVRDRGEAAGRNHRYGDRVGQFDGRFPVDAGQNTIAVDVSVDDGSNTGALEPIGQFDDAELGGLGPALDGNLAALGIDADSDTAREQPAGLAHQIGIAYGNGAQNDARQTLFEPGLDMGQRANATTELNRVPGCLEDGLNRSAIDRLAFEGAIEINHVQPFKPLIFEGQGLGGGILIVDRRRGHFAQLEPDALAVFQIDCGKQDHVRASI